VHALDDCAQQQRRGPHASGADSGQHDKFTIIIIASFIITIIIITTTTLFIIVIITITPTRVQAFFCGSPSP